MKFQREPAILYMSLVAPLAQLILILWPDLPAPTQTILSAAIPAAMGLVVAFLVRAENLVPAAVGFAQAILAVVISYGIPMTNDQQSAVLAFISLAAGIVIRDRVVAPVPADPPAIP